MKKADLPHSLVCVGGLLFYSKGGRDVIIGDILREQQHDAYKKLTTKLSKNEKDRKPNKERLSFSFWDRMMRERSDVDEGKCKGR